MQWGIEINNSLKASAGMFQCLNALVLFCFPPFWGSIHQLPLGVGNRASCDLSLLLLQLGDLVNDMQ